jgi:hypothetical protein
VKLIAARNLDDFSVPIFDDFVVSLAISLKAKTEEAWTLDVMKRDAFLRLAIKLDEDFYRCNGEVDLNFAF